MGRRLRGYWLVALVMIMYGCAPGALRPAPTPGPLVAGECPRDGDGLVPPQVPDDVYGGGLAPLGFVPTRVIRCLVDEPQTRDDGRLAYLVRELVGAPTTGLSHALALPDDAARDWQQACPARAVIPIRLMLVDAAGEAYWPRIPINWCQEPRPEVYGEVDAIAWRELDSFQVVRSP